MPVLQVELSEEQMARIRRQAKESNRTIKGLVLDWMASGKQGVERGRSDQGSVLAELKRQTRLLEALVAGGVVATSSRTSSERVSALGGALGSSRYESGYEYESD